MGAANKVPGVPVVWLPLLLVFMKSLFILSKNLILNLLSFYSMLGLKSFFQYINAKFLGILIFGMVVSYFSISKLLDFLIESYELNVWSTFFGMVVGSIYYIGKDFKNKIS